MTNQKQKILYLITKGNWGGAQRYVFDLATHLPKEQFEPIVAMGAGTALSEKLKQAGIRTVHLTKLFENRKVRPGTSDLGAFFEILHLLKTERPNIVHLNSSRASLLGALASRLVPALDFPFHLLNAKRCPLNASRVIFTAHGWPFKEPRLAIPRALIWLASYLTAFLAHHTIVLSQKDLELAKKMPGISRKLSLIYNGIEPTEGLSRIDARAKLALPSEAFVLGTIAELNRNKGISILIEALTLLPKGIHLCLIGDGEDRKKLETLAHFRSVADRITFAGTREDANAYLSAFDIFVLPSLKEGLPYTLLEAGLRRIPVVASDISGIRDIINSPLVGILVPPQKPKELSEAIQTLLKQQEIRERLGPALKERIEKTFSFDEMLGATEELYERRTR